MERINYTNIAKELLGDELYCKFIKEIAKENRGENLVDFGKEVVNKCCCFMIMIGMSKEIKVDKVKIYVGNEIIELSCKEFAMKYEKYVKKIEDNIYETLS